MEIFIGFVSGIISGLGLGGGSTLIIILINFMGISQHVAQATNIIFFIPTAIVAIIVNARQKLIDFKIANQLVFFGIIGTIVGANISIRIESTKLKHYFGIFLIIIAFYEIYSVILKYKNKKKTNNIKHRRKTT